MDLHRLFHYPATTSPLHHSYLLSTYNQYLKTSVTYFNHLTQRASINFYNTIDDNWINGPTFKIANWTVYGQPIHTNNDTEGWHHYLNTLCKGLGRENVNLYQLIKVLHKELQMVTTQAQLVTDEKLQRYQRTTYRQYQQQIFQIWDDYRTKKITAKTLLQRASHFHKPAETTENENNNDNV